ncbi:MAG: dual specificity protein phosphatase [Chromatiales bacterium]|jgi:protein-tyrosine phosphatase
MDLIIDHLAVGSADDAWSLPTGMDAMLCVAEERELPPGVAGAKVPIRDMQPIPPGQLLEAVEWLSDAVPDRCVLVFCNAGVGRSSSVAVAYLSCVERLGFGAAVERVARRHPRMSLLPDLILGVDEVRRRLRRPRAGP